MAWHSSYCSVKWNTIEKDEVKIAVAVNVSEKWRILYVHILINYGYSKIGKWSNSYHNYSNSILTLGACRGKRSQICHSMKLMLKYREFPDQIGLLGDMHVGQGQRSLIFCEACLIAGYFQFVHIKLLTLGTAGTWEETNWLTLGDIGQGHQPYYEVCKQDILSLHIYRFECHWVYGRRPQTVLLFNLDVVCQGCYKYVPSLARYTDDTLYTNCRRRTSKKFR